MDDSPACSGSTRLVNHWAYSYRLAGNLSGININCSWCCPVSTRHTVFPADFPRHFSLIIDMLSNDLTNKDIGGRGSLHKLEAPFQDIMCESRTSSGCALGCDAAKQAVCTSSGDNAEEPILGLRLCPHLRQCEFFHTIAHALSSSQIDSPERHSVAVIRLATSRATIRVP